MRVVIDTNILLSALPKISKYRLIFDSLLAGKYELAISNEIFQEYIEIIGRKTTGEIAQNLGKLIIQLDNVEKIEVYYRWNLIEKDPDDNKFVDCAVASNANLLVSNDKHFNILENIDFPPLKVINADDFLAELQNP